MSQAGLMGISSGVFNGTIGKEVLLSCEVANLVNGYKLEHLVEI